MMGSLTGKLQSKEMLTFLIYVGCLVLSLGIGKWSTRDPFGIILMILGLVGVLLIFIYVDFGFYCLVFLLPFMVLGPISQKIRVIPGLELSHIVATTTIFSVCGRKIIFNEFPKTNFSKTPVASVVFLFILMVSIIQTRLIPGLELGTYTRVPYGNANDVPWIRGISQCVQILYCIVLMMLTAIFIQNRDEKFLIRIVKIVIYGAILSTAIGFYDYVGYYLHLPRFIGMVAPSSKVTGSLGRLVGTAMEPGYYANYLIVPLSISSALILMKKGQKMFKGVMAYFIIFFFAMIFTFSAGGWAGYFVSFIIIIIIAKKTKMLRDAITNQRLFLATIILIPIVAFIYDNYPTSFDDVYKRFEVTEIPQEAHESVYIRISGDSAAWRAFLDNPILGVGIGNLAFYGDRYLPEWGFRSVSGGMGASSWVMGLLSETGILGFSSFVILIACVLSDASRTISNFEKGHKKSICIALVGAFLGILIHFLAIYSQIKVGYFWFLIGLILGTLELSREKKYQGGLTHA